MRQAVLKRLRERLERLDEMFREYVVRLSRIYPKSTIVLFGSRARGNHLPYSDFDIMVITELRNLEDKLAKAVKAYSVKPAQLSIDLLVVSEEELDDPIILKMLKEGCIILYDGLGIADRLAVWCKRLTSSRTNNNPP